MISSHPSPVREKVNKVDFEYKSQKFLLCGTNVVTLVVVGRWSVGFVRCVGWSVIILCFSGAILWRYRKDMG